MSRKILVFLVYAVPAMCVVSALSFSILRPIQVLPRIGLGPGYGMTNIDSDKITNETMRGKLVLYSFTYTNCQSGCTRLMEKMQEIRERLREVDLQGLEMELVTISIDPERDSVEKLAEYAAQFGVSPAGDQNLPAWKFLTGDNPELTKIMISTGFDLYHEKEFPEDNPDLEEYQFKHVPMAVLVDGWGIIRAEYRQYEPSERLSLSEGRSDIDPEIVLRDAGLVASEAANSKGAAKAAYGAAHLFLCYPP